MSSDEKQLPLIKASELTQYGFCRRAWWLGTVQQFESANRTALKRGHQGHVHHSHQVNSAARWRKTGFLLLGAGGLFLFIILLLWLGAG